MTIAEFIAKWQKVELRERQASSEHFCDLCRVLDHPTPAAGDPLGEDYCFERGAKKTGGQDGWADVWKRGFFGWEYKGKHKDLDKAYQQLLKYRESLDNPPLLVVSDMDRIIVRTNFENTPTATRECSLKDLSEPSNLDLLRAVFFQPDKLRPLRTRKRITEEASQRVTEVAVALGKRRIPIPPQKIARFLDRIVFCMFAQDVDLLPKDLFRELLVNAHEDPAFFADRLRDLFGVMAKGGYFGNHRIRHFNGDLFSDVEVLPVSEDEIFKLRSVAYLDWSGIDPSIFGTLFERALDPNKRGQLGAHYTSREDIEALVEPVVFAPLRREWQTTRDEAFWTHNAGKHAEAKALLLGFLRRLGSVTVLDPACGSGNFLYVVLQKLKNLEKEVIVFAAQCGCGDLVPAVNPTQLQGIEINAYAEELAQMTVWIGWLQWIRANGLGEPHEPILRKLTTFRCGDAILGARVKGEAREPEWPAAEFIVGNPPFLGNKMMRAALDDEAVTAIRRVYKGRVPGEADLCCYWFEKARAQVETGKTKRVGLLATQGIRAGASREVLRRIKHSGDIFFAVSDREWVLDGATVHVSMIGFDAGTQTDRTLDGQSVATINADLTTGVDVTTAKRLPSNAGVSFMADTKGGAFDVDDRVALAWLHEPNPNGRPNSDVLRPWVNGQDVTGRSRGMWIIDFPAAMNRAQASQYEAVFEHALRDIYPVRKDNRRAAYAERWWIHAEARPEMRRALAPLPRYLVTAMVSKHRLFAWLTPEVLADHQLIVFATDDNYYLGVLHSVVHETWARAMGSQLREAESGCRYTATSTFETFPFPEPTEAQRQATASAACQLEALRSRWLNPPEWTREVTLTFPASVGGPWAGLVTDSNADGIGTAGYTRLVPSTATDALSLRKRTLTALYNATPTWLKDAHRALDEAVFAAYGWDPALSDDALLAKLLALNLERAGDASPSVG